MEIRREQNRFHSPLNNFQQINNMNNPMMNNMNNPMMNNMNYQMSNQINNPMLIFMNNVMKSQMNNQMMNNMNNPMMNNMNNPMMNNMNNPMMNNMNNPMMNNMNNPIMNNMNNPMMNNMNNPMMNNMNNPMMNNMNNPMMNNMNNPMMNNMNNPKFNNMNNPMCNNMNNPMMNQINNQYIMKTLFLKKEYKKNTEKNNIQLEESESKNENIKLNTKQEEKNKNISEEDLKEFKEIFDFFYSEGKGSIDPQQLRQDLLSTDINNDKSKERTIKMLDKFILENNGKKMTFEEFAEVFNYESSDEENLEDLFNSIADEKNPNIISFESLKKFYQEMGENLSDDEIKEIIRLSSKDNKLELTFEEFCEIMKT